MKLTPIIASATVAAVLGSAGYAVAGATSSASTASPTAAAVATNAKDTAKPNANPKRRARRRRIIKAALDTAASTIGISPPALVQELRGGKTIAEVATEHGVTAQSVVDAIVNAATAKIEAAKTAGKITDARAARLETRLERIVRKFVNTWHVRTPKPGQGSPAA